MMTLPLSNKQQCTDLILGFVNFHKLDSNDRHSFISAKRAFSSYGKILSALAYFDYDEIDEEQLDIARNYSVP